MFPGNIGEESLSILNNERDYKFVVNYIPFLRVMMVAPFFLLMS